MVTMVQVIYMSAMISLLISTIFNMIKGEVSEKYCVILFAKFSAGIHLVCGVLYLMVRGIS